MPTNSSRVGALVIGARMIEWAAKNGHTRLLGDVRMALAEYKEWQRKTAWSKMLAGKSPAELDAMAALYEERLARLREAR